MRLEVETEVFGQIALTTEELGMGKIYPLPYKIIVYYYYLLVYY